MLTKSVIHKSCIGLTGTSSVAEHTELSLVVLIDFGFDFNFSM